MANIIVTTKTDVVDAFDGVLSLREAIATASNIDIIKFDASLTSFSTTTVDVDSTFDIAAGRVVTIDGSGTGSNTGRTNIDGETFLASTFGPLFNVLNGATLNFTSISLQNNTGTTAGGASGVNGTHGANGTSGASASVPGANGGNGTAGASGIDGSSGGSVTGYAVGGIINAGTVNAENTVFSSLQGRGGDGGSAGYGGQGGFGGGGGNGASGASGTGQDGGDSGDGANGGNGGNGGAGGDGGDAVGAILNLAGATLNLNEVYLHNNKAFAGDGGSGGLGARGGNGGGGAFGGDGGSNASGPGGMGGDAGDGGDGGDGGMAGAGGDGGIGVGNILNFGTVSATTDIAYTPGIGTTAGSGGTGGSNFDTWGDGGTGAGPGGRGFGGLGTPNGTHGAFGMTGSNGTTFGAAADGIGGTASDLLLNVGGGTGSINTVNTLISLEPDAVTEIEGDGGGGNSFSVKVDFFGTNGPSGTVDWQVVAGSAQAADFTGGVLPSGTLSLSSSGFPPSKNITFSILGDDISEGDETYTILLSNASAGNSIVNGSMAFTIIDDDQGTSGNDTLTGDIFANTIDGFAGNDDIMGRGGTDILRGGLGNDLLDGGSSGTGGDTASFSDALGNVSVYLQYTGLDVGGGLGIDTLISIENLTGGNFNDRLVGDSTNNILTGGDGNDILKGKNGDDTFFGGNGNDKITGGSGIDIIHGGAGEDILYALGGNDTLNGGDDRDFVYGGRDADTVHGDGGDDEVRGNLGNDMIFGDAGIDDLRGGGNNDMLDGGADGDFLFGENGLDTLIGGAGNDSLTGGIGSGSFDGAKDTFVYSDTASGAGGFDRIKDWEDGIDQIDLSAFGFTDFTADVLSLASNSGSNMRINFGTGDVLLVENFDVVNFDASDVLLI